jgi:signal transduction histidine kinase
MAIIIGGSSLIYTNFLVQKLKKEEKIKVELWAEATRQLGQSDLTEKNFGFLLQIIQNNTTVPVILTDTDHKILSYRNIDSLKAIKYLNEQLQIDKKYIVKSPFIQLFIKIKKYFKLNKKDRIDPITINISRNYKNYIYYKESNLLQQLTYFPYVQLGIILLFIVVAYMAFSSSRKAEQNQVWVGLTKETAHQLGTPTSSLMAWYEIVKEKFNDNDLVIEFEKDIKRLEVITERFSKIGSIPTLKPVNLIDSINSAVRYLKHRTSENVDFSCNFPCESIVIPLSSSLFEWVIENICKNSIDAIQGKGKIVIAVNEFKSKVYIDIADNGKGIPKSKHKTIFKPGYTTKTRGWGLGLSLVKRIIENYHKGKIFVLNSEPGKGTTLRIVLNIG